MDKLSVISGLLFLAADIFAIASLCMPNWIVSISSGKSNYEQTKTLWIYSLKYP